MDFIQVTILGVLLIILVETTIVLFADKLDKLRSSPRRKVYIDTSALMDGRILSVARTRFLGYDLIIPRSVLRELQLLADGKDNEKRNRARFGLDIVSDLERVDGVNVEVLADDFGRGVHVDERLLELAKKNRGLICTTDYNLNKVAVTEGIEVLNVNDLAMVLKSAYLPGERYKLKITGTGNNPGQGIGHMQDGTMVVVDNAATRVNTEVEVEILRFIQTTAGRMVFAKIPAKSRGRKKNPQNS